MRERERPPIEELIARWRARPATPWEAVVGHAEAIARLQELAAKIALTPAERTRLGLRLGAGVVLTGRPGVGKSLLARAFATALGRDVVVPPTSELDAELVGELYRALDGTPTAVVIDEAESLIGDPDWHATNAAAQRALLAVLDGVAEHPDGAPITIALTTAGATHLSAAATRPGRLAPRLELDLPGAAERGELLGRVIEGLPGAETLSLERIVERTQGWSGAELAALPEQAVTRSLLLSPPGLREELVLAVVGERYVVRDPLPAERRDRLAISRHEAGHALWACLTWGSGAVASVRVTDRDGTTTLAEQVALRRRSGAELRLLAGFALAGAAAEHLLWGADGVTPGADRDRRDAADYLLSAHELTLPFDEELLEGPGAGRGAQAMRRARYDAVRGESARLWAEVVECLRPHADALPRLGDAILAASDMTLSGAALEVAIEAALDPRAPA